jgi:hypothetical protein
MPKNGSNKTAGSTLSDEQIAIELTHVVAIATAGRFVALTHRPLMERPAKLFEWSVEPDCPPHSRFFLLQHLALVRFLKLPLKRLFRPYIFRSG